ncbi:hypothetical protein PMKS-001653 [Pichia membranifaciens]|uniref:Uncharacterized protein n=1 Tax=Pichia membranifaciens TaxID=4926 RepID=A0A1Q2YFM3_9ASCO|nr:hypothetical protein PMKS-001653 [Pichia membranifaciens]
MDTTAPDAIQQSLKNSRHAENKSLELVDPKWEMIWNETIVKQGKKSDCDDTKEEKETEKVHINDFGSETDEEETEEKDTPSSSSAQPTTKRKLQGLLRRKKKKRMKPTSSNESIT